eukprot:CAMPEP_0174313090 /NCGR_PEP_ID=MMETSP0810-20121108/4740_1 /TAXON_ID=73025 ORGANISM="Eutreptiella gymnastica-like, Strain CCMP1594" /NCGR_SAMPLE_ID=MMETSP0810 /ASSEMBLY_ACC=CAM_ASM_000659 /LENGTH=500 /DNA_ID=CAMNT_0015421731 /DNA_START=56 /DNA_END=1558 /DNA_ORIENTATION=+
MSVSPQIISPGMLLTSQPVSKTEKVRKHEYVNDKWDVQIIDVQVSPQPFAAGANRLVYNVTDFSAPKGQQNKVAKAAINSPPPEARNETFNEVVMQKKCQMLAREFNKLGPPKPINFIDACIIEFVERPMDLSGGHPLMVMEPRLEGEYKKHSNNFGFVAFDDRNTPQAFSHFTFQFTKGKEVVVDIQGVEDNYTDPQVHSNIPDSQPPVWGQGDMGETGIVKFFETHRCNALCKAMHLNGCHGLAPKPMASGTQVRPAPRGSAVLRSAAAKRSPPRTTIPISAQVPSTQKASSARTSPARGAPESARLFSAQDRSKSALPAPRKSSTPKALQPPAVPVPQPVSPTRSKWGGTSAAVEGAPASARPRHSPAASPLKSAAPRSPTTSAARAAAPASARVRPSPPPSPPRPAAPLSPTTSAGVGAASFRSPLPSLPSNADSMPTVADMAFSNMLRSSSFGLSCGSSCDNFGSFGSLSARSSISPYARPMSSSSYMWLCDLRA